MHKISKLHVRVPASSANLGPGFDCLSLAFQLYNDCLFTFHPEEQIFPEDEDRSQGNLLLRAYQAYGWQYNIALPLASVEVQAQIPPSRGLGSSAACITAGLIAAAVAGGDIDLSAASEAAAALEGQEEEEGEASFWLPIQKAANAAILDCLLSRAADLEGHPDNVAACMLGGLCLSRSEFGQISVCHPSLSSDLSFMLLIPDFELATKQARATLPESYGRKDVVSNLSALAFLLQGLAEGNEEHLRLGLQDQLHQPYRLPLISDSRRVMAACRQAGAVATVISGAGPSLLSILPGQQKPQDFLARLQELPEAWQVQPLSVDSQGASFYWE